jgi:hypothetical protein
MILGFFDLTEKPPRIGVLPPSGQRGVARYIDAPSAGNIHGAADADVA